MSFRKLLLAATALAMFAAGGAIIIVAMAFALYALAEPRFGRAGGAATVAAVTAAFIVISWLYIAWEERRKRARAPFGLSGAVLERAFEFAKQKPIAAASAAIGAGVIALRNPKYLGEMLRAFLDGRSSSK